MELIDYLRMLRRQWLWVVGSVVVLTALAAAYVTVAPKSYRATSDIYIVGTVVGGTQNENDAAQSASKYVFDNIDSFAALVDSPRVTAPVIKDLKLTETPEQLAKQVTATVVPNTVIITVAATDPSPSQAAAIANSTATSLTAVIKGLAIPGTETPLQISTVKPATPPTSPDSPNRTLWLALGVLLGLALGLVIATLREQVRRTPRTSEAAAGSDDDVTPADVEPATTVVSATTTPDPTSTSSRPMQGASVSVAPTAPREFLPSKDVPTKDVREPVPAKDVLEPAPSKDVPSKDVPSKDAPAKDTRESVPGKDGRNGAPVTSGRPDSSRPGSSSSAPTDPEAAPRDPAPTRR